MAAEPCDVLKVGILTVSDRCHERVQEDLSGKNLIALLKEKLNSLGDLKVFYGIVPDVRERIKEKLLNWCEDDCTIIFTTGGTGFSPRDVTPEATREVIEKEAPGLSTKMLLDSLKLTQMAVLSRAVCGIKERTIIINLPGSRKGSQECFESLLPILPHAIDLVRDKKTQAATLHKAMQFRSPSIPSPVAEKYFAYLKRYCLGKCTVDPGKGSLLILLMVISPHVCPHAQKDKVLHHLERVADRDRHSPYPMLSSAQALELIVSNAPVLEKEELTSLHDGLHRTLVSDVYAKEPHPPFPASIKDGYAVIASDGSGERSVLEPIAAGDVPTQSLQTGFVSRIATGAPLPFGADAVVQVEDTELVESKDEGKEEERVKILVSPTVGQDVRPIGFDIANGERVLCNGDRLGPAELGLLASVGVTKVTVVRKPRVGVLSTGNEIVTPGEVRRQGTIYDCNKTALMALVNQFGYEAVDLGIAQDNPEDLIEKFRKGFSRCDAVVTSGGVSMGEKDIIKPILEGVFNAKIHFGRVHMKPGKPTTFATLMWENTKKLIFGLPGNPVSAIVTFHLFVLPALQKMSGGIPLGLPKIKARLNFTAKLDPRPEFQRAHLLYGEDPVPDAVTTGNQCSSRLISLRSADCLLVLPPRSDDQEVIDKGSVVDALLLRRL